MIRALFKKQMMEVFSWIFQDKKSGKNRSVKGIVRYVLLYLLIFGFLGIVFYGTAGLLCQPLVDVGMGWLYFAIMGLLALFFGVLGSVFITYASLYKSKDNDFLLAMPVPSTKILLIRLSGVYFMGLMYELIVMVPAVIVWFRTAGPGAAGIICTLLISLILSVLVLVFSALLGWLVALISNRLKHKNVVVVILSLVFFAAYYYCYGHAFVIIKKIIANPHAFGDRVRGIFYPMYRMGMAAEGSLLSMLIFTAITGVLFAVVFRVLSHNFLRIATTNRGEAKAQYKEKSAVVHSVSRTLLQKELRRFLGSASYMLNCGLGIVVMLLSAGILVWKHEVVRLILCEYFPGNREVAFLTAAGAGFMLSAMNDITAPSVSLEGKNLWLVQVFPVSGRQVLMAKLKLHLILTMIPAAVLMAAMEWVLKPTVWFSVLIPVATALFILVMGEFGLFLNVKMPNLQWTSEVIPIKQSFGVMISMFGGWAFIVALAGGYILLAKLLSPLAYLAGVALLLFAVSAGLLHWLRTRGAEIFENL